jgi:hypothetical protein
LEELNKMKSNVSEKLVYLKKLNNVVEANKEVDNLIQSIKTQEGIFSEEDKNLLLKAFREEKEILVNKSVDIKKKT